MNATYINSIKTLTTRLVEIPVVDSGEIDPETGVGGFCERYAKTRMRLAGGHVATIEIEDGSQWDRISFRDCGIRAQYHIEDAHGKIVRQGRTTSVFKTAKGGQYGIYLD